MSSVIVVVFIFPIRVSVKMAKRSFPVEIVVELSPYRTVERRQREYDEEKHQAEKHGPDVHRAAAEGVLLEETPRQVEGDPSVNEHGLLPSEEERPGNGHDHSDENRSAAQLLSRARAHGLLQRILDLLLPLEGDDDEHDARRQRRREGQVRRRAAEQFEELALVQRHREKQRHGEKAVGEIDGCEDLDEQREVRPAPLEVVRVHHHHVAYDSRYKQNDEEDHFTSVPLEQIWREVLFFVVCRGIDVISVFH